jgi:hypothetical protein
VYKLDFCKYFLCFEKLANGLKSSPTHDSAMFINQLKSLAFKFFYNHKSYKIFSSVFSSSDVSAIRSLGSCNDIVVTRPDKGRGLVILDRSKYRESLMKIVADKTKFTEISEPVHKFAQRVEDKINNFLRKLKNMKHLTDDIYQQLFVSGSGPGILYGLPKIHKPDFCNKFQFRPIFAAYNTASFKLAKFLVPILAPFTSNDFTVENSHGFVQDVVKLNNANSYFMASFDIENLFTNIPLGETIEICLELLFSNTNNNVIGLSRALFKTLLENSVLNSFFIFDGKLFRQTEGLGMGLPLGPTFANIFMCYHEKIWLADCPEPFRPTFYRRYIDDTFILFRHNSHAQLFLDYLNSKHTCIKFTMECEQNSSLAFLDCKISRNTDRFESSVFRKSTFTGLGTSYFSFCSDKFKINGIKTLLSRAYKICSNYPSLHNEFTFLKSFFHNNGFPYPVIESCVRNFLIGKFSLTPVPATVNKQKYFISLPFFGAQSIKLKSELESLLSTFFVHIDFNIIMVNKFTVGSMFRFKDRLPDCMRSNVVYKFSCAQCASEYVGSTTRTLRTRVAEHAGRSFRTGTLLTHPPHSSVRSHAESCDVPVRDAHFSVLATTSNNLDLRIFESLLICKLKPKLNDMQSAFPLKIVNH